MCTPLGVHQVCTKFSKFLYKYLCIFRFSSFDSFYQFIMSCNRFCNASDLSIHNIPPGLMSCLLRLPRTWNFTAQNIAKHLPGPPSPGEIEYISHLTCDQSDNTHWHHLRHGRITASMVGQVFKHSGYWTNLHIKEPTGLIKRILGYNAQTNFTPPACAYGLAMEPVAAQLYKQQLQLPIDIESIKLHRVGLCLSAKESWIAASPDYIVEQLGSGSRVATHGDGKYLVEVKSFVRVPNVYTFQELLDFRGSSYLPYYFDEEGKCCIKRDHKHYFQIQCQLYVTGLSYCDLVMFYNEYIQVVRVDFDKTHWDSIIFPELYAFYFRFIVPEMYFKRIKRGKPMYPCIVPCRKRSIEQVD